jgi:hypothetical protein
VLHFDLDALDNSVRLEEISRTEIPYKRPRCAGKNARLDTHGWGGKFPAARIKAGGVEGFGWCTLACPRAGFLIGVPLKAMFLPGGMLRKEFRELEFPLLDWIGHFFHKPVYELVAKDPNNGYNLNIAKEFLSATRESNLYWLEEAFHEDNVLYTNLKGWMRDRNIKTLIADGEGYACQALIDWARKMDLASGGMMPSFDPSPSSALRAFFAG